MRKNSGNKIRHWMKEQITKRDDLKLLQITNKHKNIINLIKSDNFLNIYYLLSLLIISKW